jgi:spermidine/putrescine transport system ATP-binding protein
MGSAANGDDVIELDGISKHFGGFPAVRHADFTIARGEFFAMLGPSGCGKTTTLKMIAGFEQPSAGRVLLEGNDVSRVPPHRRNVNTVFQQYALFPHMTVAENVAFGPRSKKVPRAEYTHRVADMLEVVRLAEFAGRKPSQLSGGQQQRVAVARAVAGSPSILLADEPTGNLDSKNGEAVMELLRELHREGATICMVTHDPRYARHADRSIHLFDGRVVEEDGSKRAEKELEESGFKIEH